MTTYEQVIKSTRESKEDVRKRKAFLDGRQYWVMRDSKDDPTTVLNRCNLEEYKLSVEWKGTD